MLERVFKFQLEPFAREAVRSRLLLNGVPVGEVPGRVDEMQWSCASGFLLITSDGNPFEEELHFSLVNSTGELLDGLSLGQIYHAGILSNPVVNGDAIEFSFFGSERWRLTVLASRQARLAPNPFATIRSQVGLWRRHYLRLDRVSVGA